MHRVLVVPWSIAAAYFAMKLSSVGSGLRGADRVSGRAQQQVRRGGARVLVARAALAQVARAALAGHERDGGLHPLPRRVGGAPQRLGLVLVRGVAQRVD